MSDRSNAEGLGEFAGKGFTLEEDGDEFVFLMHEGETIARFAQCGAIPEEIQKEASLHMAVEHGAVGMCATMTPKK
jgi:hypothetical protein